MAQPSLAGGLPASVLLAASALAPFMSACPGPESGSPEPDRGPIEASLDTVDRTVWPGVDTEAGGRLVRRVNGWFAGSPTAYWFVGFASRPTADVFWFCRQGVDACPVDETGTLQMGMYRSGEGGPVGRPVFSAIPGRGSFPQFWLAWVVTVPEDYEADSIKSVAGIEAAADAGELSVAPVIFDHGGSWGPDRMIMHCVLVLAGTELEHNGAEAFEQPGVPTREVPVELGWHEGYQIHFVDFTANEGVFHPAEESESTPMMPTADIFVFFRDCGAGSQSVVCDTATSPHAAVTEFAVEQDLTSDGDLADNGNVISGFPRTPNADPLDRAYSPLWIVTKLRIPPAADAEVRILDTTGSQTESDLRTPAAIRDYVAQGKLDPPTSISEDSADDRIPGNDGILMFDCPSQVPDI
jgi:hypothetical protein